MTAIEWLVNEMPVIDWSDPYWKTKLDKAKEMEKKQQIDFATDFARDYIGFSSVCTDVNDLGPAAHYYNQKNKI